MAVGVAAAVTGAVASAAATSVKVGTPICTVNLQVGVLAWRPPTFCFAELLSSRAQFMCTL